MTVTLSPGARSGSVRIPASKSQAHRLLICAALGREPVDIRFEGLSNDISATIACLRALGAQITEQSAGCWRVVPISAVPTTECELPAPGCRCAWRIRHVPSGWAPARAPA